MVDKGLKGGSLGLVAVIVIGVASTAPGYSLAAGIGGISTEVGLKAPFIMLFAFVPMGCIAAAFYYLKRSYVDVIFLVGMFEDFTFPPVESVPGLLAGIVSGASHVSALLPTLEDAAPGLMLSDVLAHWIAVDRKSPGQPFFPGLSRSRVHRQRRWRRSIRCSQPRPDATRSASQPA